jgi:hypothetical protein
VSVCEDTLLNHSPAPVRQAANFITAGAVDGVLSVGRFGRAEPAAGNLEIVRFPKEIKRLVAQIFTGSNPLMISSLRATRRAQKHRLEARLQPASTATELNVPAPPKYTNIEASSREC